MTTRVYLDWNATAPLRGEARAALAAALETVGNPSSVHAEGRAARRIVEEARAAVAAATGGEPRHVVFTSGGTEANALALTPGARRGGGPPLTRLVVSAVEHPSVLAGGAFRAEDVAVAPVTGAGRIDPGQLEALLGATGPALVSVMAANNETGVIQPIAEIAPIVRAAGGLLHVDAVQALGRIDCEAGALPYDLLTVSSHKVGGPQGVGALVLAADVTPGAALIRGGGQERGRRAGTENVAGIAGFGAAITAATRGMADAAGAMQRLRDRLEAGLKTVPGTMIVAADAARLPNTTLFAAPGLKAETAVIGFDLAGIAVSSGAACSSGKVQPSHVLVAMGLPPELVRGAIRLSLGWSTTAADVDRCIAVWKKLAKTLSISAEGTAGRFARQSA